MPPRVTRPARLGATLALVAGLAAACAGPSAPPVAPASSADPRLAAAAPPSVRFSEIHFDNVGGDTGEAIEVSGPAGTDLTGWSVVLYNGNGGAPYDTDALSGTIANNCAGRGVVVINYPANGIQNGEPDGFALVNASGQVVEFLSYEGTFTAVGGAANGLTSTDIGVAEGSATPVGASLQRDESTGAWSGPSTSSFGACNTGGPPPVGPLDRLTVSGPTTVNVGATITLTALAEDAEGDDITAGVIAWSDNGSPNVTVTPSADGRTAAVRGDVAGGPATITASLTEGQTTRSDDHSVTVNAAPPPGATASLSFSGFNSAPLPPGFEDQIFATARDANNTVVTTPITWVALDPQFGTIDAEGVVRGVADGRARYEATTGDGFKDTAFVDVLTPEDPTSAAYGNHIEFGAPVDATPDDEFRVTREEFVSSYNRVRGQPNWVAYNLEATHRGPAERCDCFTADPLLPNAFPRLNTDDYTGSGYSRGHMVMSEDRTTGGSSSSPRRTSVDNARTFYFSNIVPQTSQNNSGPWLALEIYLGDLATNANKEVYIYAGGATYSGTLKNEGKVAIPTRTWKVAVVMDRNEGLANVAGLGDVQVIAIDLPNTTTVSGDWRAFQVTVDAVEAFTGYDLLSALPDNIEAVVEAQGAGVRAVDMDVQPSRISVSTTAVANVVLLSNSDFDAQAVTAADLRLVVNGGQQVAPIARNGVVNTSTRDYNGDGRVDRLVGFNVSALRAAGFAPGASSLVLRPAGTSPAFEARDLTPPTVVP